MLNINKLKSAKKGFFLTFLGNKCSAGGLNSLYFFKYAGTRVRTLYACMQLFCLPSCELALLHQAKLKIFCHMVKHMPSSQRGEME